MLHPRELATVLAALRHWQHQLARQGLALADAFLSLMMSYRCRWKRSTRFVIG